MEMFIKISSRLVFFCKLQARESTTETIHQKRLLFLLYVLHEITIVQNSYTLLEFEKTKCFIGNNDRSALVSAELVLIKYFLRLSDSFIA